MRLRSVILYLIALLPFSVKATHGNHPYYVSINRSNGLPSDEVYDMYEDERGFMWLATGSGLYRYDGFSFVQWQSEEQTSASGSCIRKDGMGRIWYENFDGYLYYTDGSKLRKLQQNRPRAFIPYGITDKYLFVLQAEGVDVFDIRTLSLVKTVKTDLYTLEHAIYANGCYYIAADAAIYRIDSSLSVSSYKIPISARPAFHQLFAGHDSLFVMPRLSGENTISVLDGRFSAIAQLPVAAAGYHRGIERIAGDMWLYTSSGCVIMNNGEINGRRSFFPGKSISKVLRDRNGNYWFATTNEGIYIVPDLNSKVYSFGEAKVRQVAISGPGVLIGTQTGDLMQLWPKDGSITSIGHDTHSAELYYLYADDQNIIYSATGYTMLRKNGSLQNSEAGIAIKAVTPVDRKYYAVAASGMCMLLPLTGSGKEATSVWDSASRFASSAIVPGGRVLLNNVRARSIAYDSVSQTIFCATNSGIVAISRSGDTHTVRYDGRAVFAAQLATFNGYIYATDTKGKLLRFSVAGKPEYLRDMPGSGTVRLLKVSGGRLYYCARGQLYEYTSEAVARPIDIHIDADEINDIAASDSILWLATNSGLMSFVRRDSGITAQAPRFYISTIMVNDSEVNSEKLTRLAFTDNNITISYSLLEFAASVPAIVAYSINGNEWKNLPGNTRSLHFRSLSPGSYRVYFRVNGKDVDGHVVFSISFPFWQQVWFYVFCVVVILFVGLAYYSYRVKINMRKVKEQKRKLHMEERLSRSMLTALRSQMNPHFFFNALNTVQAYIFTNERSKASDYLAKLSMLTRMILEMSEAETVMLTSELEVLHLYLYLEQARFGDDFSYEIVTAGISEPSAYEIPSMIIQPFVENAVKHGLLHKTGAKRLVISFALSGNELHITIDDNGIGRARSQELNEIKNRKYKSYSTRATAERVKLLNATAPGKILVDITDKATPEGTPQGTTVTIKIKLRNDDKIKYTNFNNSVPFMLRCKSP